MLVRAHAAGHPGRGEGITVTVPFSSLPATARGDRLLGTVNAYSQLHLAGDPFQRPIGSSMVDTTLQDVSYRMR